MTNPPAHDTMPDILCPCCGLHMIANPCADLCAQRNAEVMERVKQLIVKALSGVYDVTISEWDGGNGDIPNQTGTANALEGALALLEAEGEK